MTKRTDYPNTNGAYVSPDGFPLLEILSDGSGVNVKSRPVGFDSDSELESEGDKAAFQFEEERYFFGEADAAAFRDSLGMFEKATRPGKPTPEQTKYFDDVDAEHAKQAADFTRAVETGKYNTPPKAASAILETAPAAPAKSLELDAPIEDAAPGLVPDGHAVVDVPAHMVGTLPPGTVVSSDPATGVLHAHVETQSADGTVKTQHHIAGVIGQDLRGLVDRVVRYFRSVL